ncbi:MAG: TonB-dependent receptor, partial [Nitrososphaerales archaeon]
GLYALPIGPGKKFLSHGGPIGKLVGGWQLTFINTYQSGTPLTIYGGPALPLFGGGNRPNTVSGQRVVSWTGGKFDPAVNNMLNRAAFVDPPQFSIGDASFTQGAARSFPYFNENLGLIKSTPINERFRVEFRVEMFNAFNRTEFGGPDTNFDDTIGYGTIGSQENSPRQIQFYLKLLF